MWWDRFDDAYFLEPEDPKTEPCGAMDPEMAPSLAEGNVGSSGNAEQKEACLKRETDEPSGNKCEVGMVHQTGGVVKGRANEHGCCRRNSADSGGVQEPQDDGATSVPSRLGERQSGGIDLALPGGEMAKSWVRSKRLRKEESSAGEPFVD